jgi:hypothetical protein
VLFVTFLTGVYEHPQFKLLYLLSEFYKGSLLTLSIVFLILVILYSPRSSQGKIIYLFSLKHRAWISTLPPDHHRERQYISFLLNIELVSLRFYVLLLHRGISMGIMTIVITLISYNSC